MLSKLFISKVRVNMLEQFLFNRGEEYHVRALVRIMDEEINAIRRELQNLEDAGILISQKKGNKLCYRLKEDNMYLDDLTSLLYKDTKPFQIIHKNLTKLKNLQTALITENFINEQYENDNDIDLLLLGDLDMNELKEALKEIENKIERELRTTVMKPEDVEFHHKKRDPFLLNILRGNKIMLIGQEKDLI